MVEDLLIFMIRDFNLTEYLHYMIKKNVYSQSLLGLTKKEVVEEFGKGLNSYTDDIWHYELSKTWWGLKTIMFLEFENNMVSAKYIKYVFRKINPSNKRLQKK